MGTPKGNYVHNTYMNGHSKRNLDLTNLNPTKLTIFFLGHSLWAWQAWRRGIHETNDSYFITAINSLPGPLRGEVLEDLQG